MRFKFALESVLLMRRQREQAEERALQATLSELRETQRTLEWVRSELRRRAEERNSAPAAVVQATMLQEQYARLALLEGARAETEARVKAAEERVAERQQLYLRARREREVLEELEQQQRSFHAIEALRREAKRTDDLLLGRRLRG